MDISNFLLGRDIKERSQLDSKGTYCLSSDEQIRRLKSRFPHYRLNSFLEIDNNLWEVSCDFCRNDLISSLDVGLSKFKATTIQLRGGVKICRCHRPLNKIEATVEIKNTLESEGGSFIGWTGDIIGNNELFTFYDNKGHKNKISYGNFKVGKRCKLCANNRLSEEKIYPLSYWQGVVDQNPKYPLGTKIVEYIGDRTVTLYCPCCEKDIYYKNNLGGCTFEIRNYKLYDGNRPCRCNNILNKDQMTFKIETLLNTTNKHFVRWIDENVNSRSYFEIECDKGTKHLITYDNFINNGYRCVCCGERSFGFDASKPAYMYVVRWFGYGESYLKFGITNRKVIDRIEEQSNNSKHLDYEIIYTCYNNKGMIIQDIERKCKQTLEVGVCPKKWLPDGYTETVHDTFSNLNKIIKLIDQYNQK